MYKEEWLLPRLRECRKNVEPPPPPSTMEEDKTLGELDDLRKQYLTGIEIRFSANVTLNSLEKIFPYRMNG